MRRSCLVLFSGGLDSILACKILQGQGIDVIGIKFITPFFSYHLADGQEAGNYKKRIRERYGIKLEVVDITAQFLKMVTMPVHGYGRYLNPCVDCKILMVKKALSLLGIYGASFIATGEVLGQRPMSQRRDTLRIIERDSGAEGLLLRPLSARFLKETIPEIEGVVDRLRLPAISGRSRKKQMRLSARFGIEDYPAPAGGCVLADPILSKRFERIFSMWPDFTYRECLIAQTGRHFILPDGGWLIVGRNKAENDTLLRLVEREDDITLSCVDRAGPICVLKRGRERKDIRLAASICVRYSKGNNQPVKVRVESSWVTREVIVEAGAFPTDSKIRALML